MLQWHLIQLWGGMAGAGDTQRAGEAEAGKWAGREDKLGDRGLSSGAQDYLKGAGVMEGATVLPHTVLVGGALVCMVHMPMCSPQWIAC